MRLTPAVVKIMLKLRALVAILALTPCAVAAQSSSADYPVRPIRFLVGFAPGGVSDVTARTIATKWGEILGQTFFIENRGGAGGTIATDMIAKAAPDGYTVGLCSLTTNAIAPNVYKRLAYHPIDDFAPIGLATNSPNLIAVNTSVAARSVNDVIALARAKPGQLSYASSGVGSMMHLAGEMMLSMAKIDMIHVPYKGVALAYPDVFSGQVPVIFDSVVSAAPHIRSGRLRALAVTSKTRSSALPDVPTMAEAGLAGYEMTSWQGICAPAKTPTAVIARLNRDLNTALRTPDLREKLVAQGNEILGGTPQEHVDTMRRDLAAMAKLVKAAGVQPE